jgi:hypothetical protein
MCPSQERMIRFKIIPMLRLYGPDENDPSILDSTWTISPAKV